MGKKVLYILRHAKAEEGAPGVEDHERHLIERGVKAAHRMGQWMVDKEIAPDKVLCSTSARTTETLIKIEEAYKHPLPVEYSDKLYLASANAIVTVISGLPDEVEKVLLVGHNPGLHQLALKLARTGDKKLFEKLAVKFPTGSLAEIDMGKITWRDVARLHGELKRFISPKELD